MHIQPWKQHGHHDRWQCYPDAIAHAGDCNQRLACDDAGIEQQIAESGAICTARCRRQVPAIDGILRDLESAAGHHDAGGHIKEQG